MAAPKTRAYPGLRSQGPCSLGGFLLPVCEGGPGGSLGGSCWASVCLSGSISGCVCLSGSVSGCVLSVHTCFRLSVCLSVLVCYRLCLSVCPHQFQAICLSVCAGLFQAMSVCSSTSASGCLSLCLCGFVSGCVCLCLFQAVSVCLSRSFSGCVSAHCFGVWLYVYFLGPMALSLSVSECQFLRGPQSGSGCVAMSCVSPSWHV